MEIVNIIKKAMSPRVSDAYKHEIDLANLKNINRIAIFMSFVESFGMIICLSSLIRQRSTEIRVIFQVGFCLIMCIIISLITRRVLRAKRVNHHALYSAVIFMYTMFICWGMFVSYFHYTAGEQILTFYVVIIVLVAFVYMSPKLGTVLTFSSFAIFFLLLYRYDKAVQITAFNYFSFALVCCVGSVSKYYRMLNQLDAKDNIRRLNETLSSAARQDYMTKLKNRLSLFEDSKECFGREICVVMCDCNKFKFINDEYGHIVGDRVICEIADILRKSFDEKYIYRFGGDEFLLIITEPDEDVIKARIEQVTREIGAISVSDFKEPVTCSFGCCRGNADSFDEFEKLIAEADKTMYKNKKFR
ncbi:MAG: GGDEF domain-containing protein [Ruminococcaceae bacterium]|nr:GGDEF domain-containing protein [Oscillospiraceae bacterium]